MELQQIIDDFRKSIVEDIRSVICEELERLKSPVLSRQDIAEEIGKYVEYLSRNPWVLPNHGKPDIPGSPDRWLRETWEAWKKNLPEHRRRWEAMSRRDREKILNIA